MTGPSASTKTIARLGLRAPHLVPRSARCSGWSSLAGFESGTTFIHGNAMADSPTGAVGDFFADLTAYLTGADLPVARDCWFSRHETARGGSVRCRP